MKDGLASRRCDLLPRTPRLNGARCASQIPLMAEMRRPGGSGESGAGKTKSAREILQVRTGVFVVAWSPR